MLQHLPDPERVLRVRVRLLVTVRGRAGAHGGVVPGGAEKVAGVEAEAGTIQGNL